MADFAATFRRQIDRLPDLDGLLFQLTKQIPVGSVTTYGTLAQALGNRIASKWVGLRLLNHDHDLNCSCHRVVRAGGAIGRFVTGDTMEKIRLLQSEDIEVKNQMVPIENYFFDGFDSPQPLAELQKLQKQIAKAVLIAPNNSPLRLIAGIDVSYQSYRGTATCVLFDRKGNRKVHELHLQREMRFPYISTYLAFRELPVLLELVEKMAARQYAPDVMLVDGSGMLHPRKSGIASMLGVLSGIPTIGVTKKVLVGGYATKDLKFGQPLPVKYHHEHLGFAILPNRKTKKPLFISPGHQISVEQSLEVVEACITEHRLPEPIYWADKLSRQIANSS